MPITDYKLDPITHDLVIEGGDYVLIDGKAEVAQAIKIHLLTLKAEWFLDPSIGWLDFQADFRSTPNLRKMRQVVFNEIRAVPGVRSVEITVFDLDRDAGNLRIEYTAAVDDGLLSEAVTL